MDEAKEVADLFRESWDEFTRTDRKVARVILANYPAAGLETLARLSERANVSAPSVLRCVKKLGFDGYPEFQQALHAEVHQKIRDTTDRSPIEVEGSAAHLPVSVQERAESYYLDIAETLRLLQPVELETVVGLLADESRNLIMLGGRRSSAMARVLYRRLMMIRPHCSLLGRDPLERSERLIDIGRKDVLVTFDHPPYESGTASFASLAKERQARIVLFTDTAMSPIAEIADNVICAASGSDPEFSTISTACLVEIVAVEVWRVTGRIAQKRQQELEGIDHSNPHLE